MSNNTTLVRWTLNPFDKRRPKVLFTITYEEFEQKFPKIAELENKQAVLPIEKDLLVSVFREDGSHFIIGYSEVAYTCVSTQV